MLNQKTVIYIILSAILLYLYYIRRDLAVFAAFAVVVTGTLIIGKDFDSIEGMERGDGDGDGDGGGGDGGDGGDGDGDGGGSRSRSGCVVVFCCVVIVVVVWVVVCCGCGC